MVRTYIDHFIHPTIYKKRSVSGSLTGSLTDRLGDFQTTQQMTLIFGMGIIFVWKVSPRIFQKSQKVATIHTYLYKY